MEFKGKERAEEYASEKSSSPVFKENHIKDYLSSYNQAFKDSKASEMLDMLKEIIYSDSDIEDVYIRAEQLIKQATEL